MQAFKRKFFRCEPPAEGDERGQILLTVDKKAHYIIIHSIICTPKELGQAVTVVIAVVAGMVAAGWKGFPVIRRIIKETVNIASDLGPMYLEPGDVLLISGSENLDGTVGWLNYTEITVDEEEKD